MQAQAQLQSKQQPPPKASFLARKSGLLQRKCSCGGTAGVDGQCAECRNERLQHRSTEQSEPSTAPPIVHEVLRSPGQPLDASTRAFMEPRFGHDFSQVRIHTDARAGESAQAVNALAYTVGRDVVFGAGRYEPGTSEGQKILAHELAHTIQQGPGVQRLPDKLETTDPGDSAEKEAQAAARAAMQGQLFDLTQVDTLRIARQMPELTPATSGPAQPGTTPAQAPTPSAIRTVKVWLNAFIPDTVPGKTIPAPGPHAGKTMLNGPIFSECYLTDNRSFDSNVHAPSRMHSEIEIDVAGPTEVFQWHNCDETHEINCKTGAAVCTSKGRTSDMLFSKLRGSSGSLIQVDLKGASNNPCYSGSPDIDYEGRVTINVGARTVEFDGKIDQFPAFEMYGTANGGAGAMMFNSMPLPGKDPWNLPREANRAQKGSATI
jgi:hypothetical protein